MIGRIVGGTPTVRLRRVVEPGMAGVWAKLEGMNPAGSIKDRTALALVRNAEERGLLGPGGVLVEPTSGNTGIGLAQVAAARGYRLILCLPASMSEERKRTLRAYGAELVLTDAEGRMPAAIAEAERIARETGAHLAGQFTNPANAPSCSRWNPRRRSRSMSSPCSSCWRKPTRSCRACRTTRKAGGAAGRASAATE